MAINILNNIKLIRGKRPAPLSKYTTEIPNKFTIPYPIQSDVKKNSGYLDDYKKYFDTSLGFNFSSCKKGDLLIYGSCDIGEVVELNIFEAFIDDKFIKIVPNNNINKKYLKYWLTKNKHEISKEGYGTTFKVLYLEPLKHFLRNKYIPIISAQEQIIDIIEPFENIKINLINKLKILNNISNILINKYNKKELMINNCCFIKGKTPISTDFVNYSKIPFINVSAINNNINKYLDENKYSSNVNYGDVILSLDGTVGIVNNFIYGYNGYGYKVVSDNYENYKLYYSLKHTINQNIIINNTLGSVIKHANKSKNFLYVFWFENEYLLSKCYKYEILIKKQILVVEKIINLLISNYII